MLTHRIVQDYAGFLALEPEWNSLAARSSVRGRVFLDYDWLDTWVKVYAHTDPLFIVTIYDHAKLVAIAPLYLASEQTPWGRTYRTLRFMGGGYVAGYHDILCAADNADPLYELVFDIIRRNKAWSRVQLEDLDGRSPLVPFIRRSFAHSPAAFQACRTCLSLDLTAMTWEEYEKTAVPRNVKYYVRKLSKLGCVKFQEVTREREAVAFSESFIAMHRRGWQQKGGDRYGDDQVKRFFQEVTRRLFQKGMADLTYLSLDSRPIAYHFGVKDGDTYYGIAHTFEPDLRKYGVGKVLLYHLIKNRYDFSEMDLLDGTDPYKFDFNPTVRTTHRLMMYKAAHWWANRAISSLGFVKSLGSKP